MELDETVLVDLFDHVHDHNIVLKTPDNRIYNSIIILFILDRYQQLTHLLNNTNNNSKRRFSSQFMSIIGRNIAVLLQYQL